MEETKIHHKKREAKNGFSLPFLRHLNIGDIASALRRPRAQSSEVQTGAIRAPEEGIDFLSSLNANIPPHLEYKTAYDSNNESIPNVGAFHHYRHDRLTGSFIQAYGQPDWVPAAVALSALADQFGVLEDDIRRNCWVKPQGNKAYESWRNANEGLFLGLREYYVREKAKNTSTIARSLGYEVDPFMVTLDQRHLMSDDTSFGYVGLMNPHEMFYQLEMVYFSHRPPQSMTMLASSDTVSALTQSKVLSCMHRSTADAYRTMMTVILPSFLRGQGLTYDEKSQCVHLPGYHPLYICSPDTI